MEKAGAKFYYGWSSVCQTCREVVAIGTENEVDAIFITEEHQRLVHGVVTKLED